MWTASKRAFSTFGRVPIPGGGGGRGLLFALPLVILPATYGYFEYYWNNKQEDGGSKAIKPEEPALKLNEHAPVKEFIAKTEDLLRNREEAPKVVPVLKHKEEINSKREQLRLFIEKENDEKKKNEMKLQKYYEGQKKLLMDYHDQKRKESIMTEENVFFIDANQLSVTL